MAVAGAYLGLRDAAVSLGALTPLDESEYASMRRRAIFKCCKWDPQVGDQATLCPFPLVLTRSQWLHLAAMAERLAQEALAAEREIAARRDLIAALGLPRLVVRALHSIEAAGFPCSLGRVIRFDFHLCDEGWRVSEANSDVPGGFIEASGFTQLMAEHYRDCEIAGDPAASYCDAVARGVDAGGLVAMIHATAYTDDRQVMTYLARQLEARGVRAALASPANLSWHRGRASLVTPKGRTEPLAAIVRFFPGEWLPNLPRSSGWPWLLAGSRTPLSNPATALVTQSKRFPLVWDRLRTPLPTWRALLPPTHSPVEAAWQRDDAWVLKPALGRVGESIAIRGVTPEKAWGHIAREAARRPHEWVAQRRFAARPVATCEGLRYPVLGVFTIDGCAAGIYGRLAARPLIDDKAQEVAVLVQNQSSSVFPFWPPL